MIFVESGLQQREFVVGSNDLRRVGDDRSLVQVIVNVLYRVVHIVGESLVISTSFFAP